MFPKYSRRGELSSPRRGSNRRGYAIHGDDSNLLHYFIILAQKRFFPLGKRIEMVGVEGYDLRRKNGNDSALPVTLMVAFIIAVW